MSRPCTTCGGTEHYTKEVDATSSEGPNLLPIGFWRRGKLVVRVCDQCGTVTWRVPERLMPGVREKFAKEA